MKKDLIMLYANTFDLIEINKLLEKGYVIQSKNYDARVDAVSYHLRITFLSWIFSKLKPSK